jgi:hypothetical protein
MAGLRATQAGVTAWVKDGTSSKIRATQAGVSVWFKQTTANSKIRATQDGVTAWVNFPTLTVHIKASQVGITVWRTVAGGAVTAKFRRTLSQLGTRVGKRQHHGWNQ